MTKTRNIVEKFKDKMAALSKRTFVNKTLGHHFTSHQNRPNSNVFLLRQPIVSVSEWENMLKDNKAALNAERLAQKGDPKAQHAWGMILFEGLGIEKNPVEAFAWLSQAASQNHPPSMNMVGRCYEYGWGVDVNDEEACYWYGKAAENSDPWAMYNLADLLRRGKGIEQDHQQAICYYKKSLDHGNIKAYNMLGMYYEEGNHTDSDKDKAQHYFLKGAEAGDCWACFNYARLLALKENMEGTIYWLEHSLSCHIGDYCLQISSIFKDHPNHHFQAIAKKAAVIIGEQYP